MLTYGVRIMNIITVKEHQKVDVAVLFIEFFNFKKLDMIINISQQITVNLCFIVISLVRSTIEKDAIRVLRNYDENGTLPYQFRNSKVRHSNKKLGY